jgi:hypothetical protein
MRFWSCLQSIVVLAAALGSASPTPQTAESETGVAASSGSSGTTSAADAAKQELQQAAMLLASMPACGVSKELGGCLFPILDAFADIDAFAQRNCLTGAIAASPCELTDLACSCSNATITQEVSICIMGACTIKQSLSKTCLGSRRVPCHQN